MIKSFVHIFLFAVLISQNVAGQITPSAKITTWYKDKPGAISVTFDDASYTQYEYAYPVLEKYNIKATFSLVGEWTHEKPTFSAEPGIFEIKKMGWQQIKELNEHNHEIAAHGYVHKKYGKWLSTDILSNQMKKIKDLIEKKLKTPVYTIHYPYSFTSDSIVSAARKAGFLFGRTQGEAKYNNPYVENMYLLVSRAILADTIPQIKEFKEWIQDINGRWLILMYHHLFTKNALETRIMQNHNVTNTYSLYPGTFERQMHYFASSDYWIAPVASVGKYIEERKNTEIKIKKFRHKITITTSVNLDTGIYNQPLTLEVVLPWKKVKVKGSESDGVFEVEDNRLLIDFLPGKTIKIKKKH